MQWEWYGFMYLFHFTFDCPSCRGQELALFHFLHFSLGAKFLPPTCSVLSPPLLSCQIRVHSAWVVVSARTILFEPGIHIVETVEFPCRKPHDIQHEFIHHSLKIGISTFPLFTIVMMDRENGRHRSSLWRSCWDMRKGGHLKLGPLCLAHLPPLQPPKWSGEGEVTLWCILFTTPGETIIQHPWLESTGNNRLVWNWFTK